MLYSIRPRRRLRFEEIENPRLVTSVKCPRKGPIPSEISLLRCGQMNDTGADLCASYNCQKAVAYWPQLEQLRAAQRNASASTLSRVFSEALLKHTAAQASSDSASSDSASSDSASPSSDSSDSSPSCPEVV